MTEDTSAGGFRSLVQQIQQNDVDADERQRPQRRRLTLRREPRPEAPAQAPVPPQKTSGATPIRLLQRRWL